MSAACTICTKTSPIRSDPHAIWHAVVSAASSWQELALESFADLDWGRLTSAAQYHGLLPIVAERVLESDIAAAMDVSSRNSLRRAYQTTLFRVVSLYAEVIRIVLAMREQGIGLIPYKGPVLAQELWGNASRRECVDLDFLVRRADVVRSGEVIEKLGYRRASPIAGHLLGEVLRHASEIQFRNIQTGLLLELQWSPAPRVFGIEFDAAAIWNRTRTISFGGQQVLAPSTEDLLTILSIHGWKHNWERLIWVGDIAHLLKSAPIDWDRLSFECKSKRNFRIVALALQIAARVFRTSLPKQFNRPDHVLNSLADELVARMINMNPNRYLDWHRNMLLARDGRLDQLRQISSFLFTPGLGEYAACDLPRWATGGYRAIRIARLLQLTTRKVRE